MTFLHPLGLLGLIGIPILIIIYILKNKFIEQIIPSTYLWTLSERFIKRRNPLNKLSGIISLVLQLLLVTVISLSIAHPVLILKGEAREYTFILDGSGSMSMEQDGKTRIEVGKDRISSVISESTDGSTFTLILVSEGTRVVYEKTEDKEKAVELLSDLSGVAADSPLNDALGIAQDYFNKNRSSLVYLITDKDYERTENVNVINVARQESNHALLDVYYSESSDRVSVYGKLRSYGFDGTLNVSVYVDDGLEPAVTEQMTLTKDTVNEFRLTFDSSYFESLTVKAEHIDSLVEDDTVVIYNSETENNYKALLVSDTPFFIKSVINAVSTVDVETVATKDYAPKSGYDLYIFDSFTPYDIPTDGTIWFFNPTASTASTGFSVQGIYEPGPAIELELSSSTSTIIKKLTANMTGEGIYTTKYVKCGLYDNFSVLLEHKGNPVVFTGSNEFGNREVVFAFDLHDSNLPLLTDFVALCNNLVDFSFPTVIERTDYVCGEYLSVNVISGCDSIIVKAPSGSTTYLPVGDPTAEMYLSESGVHEIEISVSGNPKKYYVFSEFPSAESDPAKTGEEIILLGEAGGEGIDGKYDNIVILFVLLMLLFCADWVVYCYEKYQLR